MNVAVIDIGKPGVNFGWAMVGNATAEGTDIDVCVQTLAAAPRMGPLALGFEAPMFVPIRNRRRRCHGTRNRASRCVLCFRHSASTRARGDGHSGLEIPTCRSRPADVVRGRSSLTRERPQIPATSRTPIWQLRLSSPACATPPASKVQLTRRSVSVCWGQ